MLVTIPVSLSAYDPAQSVYLAFVLKWSSASKGSPYTAGIIGTKGFSFCAGTSIN